MQARVEALEWALALSRAPAERIALRQRPLPGGVLELLQIAAGSDAGSLEQLAATSGEETAHIQEAARFYIREVLFYQGADAYRVLGVPHDASTETLRAHHRLLQRWLHPDRQTSDWDAIFAARVNAAWSQLRSDDRRAAYDLEHPPRTFSNVRSPSSPLPWQVSDASVPASADPARWRRRMPTLALFATCMVLGLLAIRESQTVQDLEIPNEAGVPAVLHKPAVMHPPPAVQPAMSAAGRGRALPVVAQRPTEPARRAVAALAPAQADIGLPAKLAVADTLAGRAPKPVQAMTTTNAVPPADVVPPAGKQSVTPTEKIARAAPPAAAEPARNSGTNAPARPLVTESRRPLDAPGVRASSEVPLSRVQDAQDVGGQLIRFMTTAGSATPPIWASLTAERGATQLRADLVGQGEPRMEPPHWRVGEKVAAMHAALQYADGNAGRLTADLVWRDQRWLVTGLSVERDR